MGVLFSTPDNWMMHQTERFVKGTGKFLSRTGERFVRSESSQAVKSGAIGRGFDRIGESISKSARKTANFAHNVTQKGRNLLRKNNKINNYSYQQLPPNANKQNKNTNPELPPPNAKKNAAANNAAAKKDVNNNSYISPASSELTQPTVSNTANKPKNVNNLVVKPNSVKNSGSTVQNTSSTKAANNEMYSSILKKLEGLKEDMKKKVDEDFRNRISKPGSKLVTISQIGGPNFTRLIKLFLIIQKLRNNNNNNTKKLELDLKELLESRVIDKKSKNPEDLLEEYKTKISTTPIDVLKREFNEECKELFPYYTRIDESEIPQINSPNNNAKSNTNTVVGNNNQSILTEELNNLNSKSKTLPLPVDQLQPAITSGGSRKKSKKSRS
jgi:hypothetical protein